MGNSAEGDMENANDKAWLARTELKDNIKQLKFITSSVKVLLRSYILHSATLVALRDWTCSLKFRMEKKDCNEKNDDMLEFMI